MNILFGTNDDLGLTVLRVLVGLVIAAHGAQKLLGWFGGHGFRGTMGYLTGTAGLPSAIALLVIVIEFFGGLGLVAGLLTRPAALGIIAVMVGAVITAHLPNGFFMNWTGTQKGEGWEFHVIVVAGALALLWNGGGRFSVDSWIAGAL